MTSRLWLLVAALILVAGTPARSASPRDDSAHQLAGLFMQSCLPYAGNAADLRAWAQRTGLPAVPPPAREAFLLGAGGQAFDASNQAGKYVVVSGDDGLCSTLTDHALSAPVTVALENDFRQAGIDFRLAIERDDTVIGALHHREYLAAKGGRAWRILVATVTDAAGGQAMLTAAPE